jgi:5-(carboxyamino)imidazole ribonucleotide mutase
VDNASSVNSLQGIFLFTFPARTDCFLSTKIGESVCFRAFYFGKRLGGTNMNPKVAVIMGSKSDWETMKHACETLDRLDIPYEKKVVSAHRTPDLMFDYADSARNRGIKVIIAGAGGAAHLPGMVAAKTTLPVIGIPVQSKALNGLDSLLSIVQMPAGVPVATVAIGKAGATNAGLLAAQILSITDPELAERLERIRQEAKIAAIESSDELV